jgi:Lar family restriction alleviation protein
MNATTELKPCPFCGYDLRESSVFECVIEGADPLTHKKYYRVNCPFCGCCAGRQHSKKEAVAAWNRRAGDAVE